MPHDILSFVEKKYIKHNTSVDLKIIDFFFVKAMRPTKMNLKIGLRLTFVGSFCDREVLIK